ncbi:MAG: Gfo/Idh/MocA family oxidoreductase [Rhodospirillales bacterium]
MKVLLVGTGGIGGRHARFLRTHYPEAHLIAVRNTHNEITRDLNMDLFPNLEEAIACGPNAAIVALPPSLHGMIACKILKAGIALYLEKPVAISSHEIEDVAFSAETNGVITMSGCNLRFLPGFRRIRGLLAERALGRILCGHLSVGQWLPDWRPGRDYRTTYSAQRKLGGGVICDLIHELDLARFLFGEFSVGTAHAGTSGALEIDCEDWAEILLTNKNFTVSIHLDYLDRAGHRHGYIEGEAGSLRYDVLGGSLSCFDAEVRTWSKLGDDQKQFSIDDSYRIAISHFFECVEQDRQTELPISEGIKSLKLAEAIRRAAGLPL